MGKLLIGLVIGVVVSGGVGLIAIPKIKQAAYDKGYDLGNKDGTAKGTTAGIATGIAQITAVQAQKHADDSVASVKKYQEARRKAAMSKRRVAPKPIQNWHVIDGKIEQPITDSPI